MPIVPDTDPEYEPYCDEQRFVPNVIEETRVYTQVWHEVPLITPPVPVRTPRPTKRRVPELPVPYDIIAEMQSYSSRLDSIRMRMLRDGGEMSYFIDQRGHFDPDALDTDGYG